MRIGYDAKRIFHNTTGLGNYSRDLVRILAKFYPDNQYFLYNPKSPKVNRLALQSNMKVKMPESFFGKILPSLWRSKFIINDLKRDQIDIYHGLSGELPFNIKQANIKSVVTIHDLIFLRFPELYKPIDRKIYFKKFLKAANNADKIVAISEQTKLDIINFLEVNPQKIRVIYQGCHQAFKQDYEDDFKDKVRLKYQLPEHYLLNVGTIEPRKNAFSIVKAIKDTTHHLVLVGKKTDYAQQIVDYVKKHQIEDRIHFLSNVALEELAVIYQMADIFLYPSIFEGFGIPIIEAMFSKTPVITNKNGVFPEAAGPYSYYLEDPENPDEIKALIQSLMIDKQSDRIEKSYIYAKNNFSDEIIASHYHDLYKKL